MSIKEWVKSPRNSLSGWDDRSLIVCPLFEIIFFKNIYEKKEKKRKKRKRQYEVSRNGYGSLAMFQVWKAFIARLGHPLCCYVVKASLEILKSKIDLKSKAYIFVFL